MTGAPPNAGLQRSSAQTQHQQHSSRLTVTAAMEVTFDSAMTRLKKHVYTNRIRLRGGWPAATPWYTAAQSRCGNACLAGAVERFKARA